MQPSCSACIEGKETRSVPKKTTDYNGRIALIKSPANFCMDFSFNSFKRPIDKERGDSGHSCEMHSDGGENFNRYGDLCWKCRELNSTTVSHDGAVSEIFLDKVVNAGPSVMFRFYMDHQGKPKHGLPLFNDPGVSTIDV